MMDHLKARAIGKKLETLLCHVEVDEAIARWMDLINHGMEPEDALDMLLHEEYLFMFFTDYLWEKKL